jgi:hypothetical protein
MVGSQLDHRRAFLGLRARAFDIGANAKSDLASSYTFAKIQGMQAKMSGGVNENNSRIAIFASFENILERSLSCLPLRCWMFAHLEWPAMSSP